MFEAISTSIFASDDVDADIALLVIAGRDETADGTKGEWSASPSSLDGIA
jgi:hypothetical protein